MKLEKRVEHLIYGTGEHTTHLEIILTEIKPSDVKDLEMRQGVYMIYGLDRKLMYVGESNNLKRRLQEHMSNAGGHKEINKDNVSHIEYAYLTNTNKYERNTIEGILVSKYKPTINMRDEVRAFSGEILLTSEQRVDLLFYLKEGKFKDAVLAKAFGLRTPEVSAFRNNGIGNGVTLPEGYTPKLVITKEFADSYKRTRNTLTKEQFFGIRADLDKGIRNKVIADKFGINPQLVTPIKKLSCKKYQKWEQERQDIKSLVS